MTTFLPALRSASLLRPFLGDFFADLDDFAWPTAISADQAAGFRMDVAEYQDKYVIVADLPGKATSDVDITLHNSHLSIGVTSQVEVERSADRGVRFILRERRSGTMRRTVQLPHATSEKNVEATMKDGVLTVTIKKDESSTPKKIAVH